MKKKSSQPKGPISQFLLENFRHFNAAVVIDSAQAYRDHLDNEGKMMVTLAGAMSTAELGISLAEMIRADAVHLICCTGANLEEDIFNLVAHHHYKRIPHYRSLSLADEEELFKNHLNRVTDTCIPENEALRKIESFMLSVWTQADKKKERYFPHEFFYQILRQKSFSEHFQIDPKNSWMMAACEKNIPIIVPGWEDSTLGNMYAAACIRKEVHSCHTVKTGIEYMMELVNIYTQTTQNHSFGMFQIGGGIAGDFPICVVPLIHQDLQKETPHWGYFSQISDSTTSYGSYSGATPSEKITWGKLNAMTPQFIIESDATIVAPLIFGYVLNK